MSKKTSREWQQVGQFALAAKTAGTIGAAAALLGNGVTDRAKRYRAQRNKPPGRRQCNICSSRQNVEIDHIRGDEDDGEPQNLWYLCRRCNTSKGVQQARHRIGRRTRQYNPRGGVRSLEAFRNAGAVLIGLEPGDVAEATEKIYATSPKERARFAAMAARNPLFAPQQGFKQAKFSGVNYGLEIDITGRGRWEEAGIFKTKRAAETEGRRIERRDGFPYRVKATRDRRPNPDPTYQQYSWAVAQQRHSGAHDEAGAIIHATPAKLRSEYAKRIAATKRKRGTGRRSEVPF